MGEGPRRAHHRDPGGQPVRGLLPSPPVRRHQRRVPNGRPAPDRAGRPRAPRADLGGKRKSAHRSSRRTRAELQRRNDLGLRQGRADRQGSGRRDRCRQEGRHSRNRRSQESRLVGLQGRNRHHAQPQGAPAGDPAGECDGCRVCGGGGAWSSAQRGTSGSSRRACKVPASGAPGSSEANK